MPTPNFKVPAGAVAKVSIIDTTTRMSNMLTSTFMGPPLPGFEVLSPMPAWSFLVESDTGKKALFDLGTAPNWQELPAPIVDAINSFGWNIATEKHVADILREHQHDPASINSIIWSHWHYDHLGDPTTFPSSTELVVGPGFKQAFTPGYPANQTSPVLEIHWAGRELREVSFDGPETIKIGQMRAFDFFGDGSFYLLDAPGHAIGHLAGLARTTENTFIMMGADLCHHSAEIRPSPYVPLPDQVRLDFYTSLRGGACPGSVLQHLQKSRSRAVDEPFFEPKVISDLEETIETIKKSQEADAEDNILFIFAHDCDIIGLVDLFPKPVNDWHSKGIKQKLFWLFLRDFKAAILNETKT